MSYLAVAFSSLRAMTLPPRTASVVRRRRMLAVSDLGVNSSGASIRGELEEDSMGRRDEGHDGQGEHDGDMLASSHRVVAVRRRVAIEDGCVEMVRERQCATDLLSPRTGMLRIEA